MNLLSKMWVVILFTTTLSSQTVRAEEASTGEVTSNEAAAQSTIESTAQEGAEISADSTVQTTLDSGARATVSTPEFTTALGLTTVVVVAVAYTTHKWDQMQTRQNYERAAAEAKVRLANSENTSSDGILAQVAAVERELFKRSQPEAKLLTDQQVALLIIARSENWDAQFKTP